MTTSPFQLNPTFTRLGAAAAMLLATSMTAHAAIVVAGPQTYTENFDTLPSSGDVPWVDDSTVPGFIAGANSNNTPDGNLKATDGAASLNGLLNLGTALSNERALGSKSTSGDGFANIAYAVVFQNTSPIALTVTNVSYTGELWRTNKTPAGLAEQWFTYYKTSTDPILDSEPGPNSATPNDGTFTPAPELNWSSPNNLPPETQVDGNDPANRVALSGTLDVTVQPGEYFAFRWVDTNSSDVDGFQGIDDVSITFVPEPLSASVALIGGALVLLRRRRNR